MLTIFPFFPINILCPVSDVVLEDFCDIANRTTDIIPHKRHYMRNVFTESIGQMGLDPTCTDPNAPMVSRATACSLMAEEISITSEADTPEADTDDDEDDTAQDEADTAEDEPDTAEEDTPETESSSSRTSLVGAQFCVFLLYALHVFVL